MSRRLILPLLLILTACSTGAGVPPGAASVATSSTTVTSEPSFSPSAGSTSTSTTSITGGSTTTTIDLATRCERIAPPIRVGTVVDPALDEVSGIASSRAHEGVLWVHNDSGGDAEVVAIDFSGRTLGVVSLTGAARDWEDIALGAGPGGDYVYVGDIGDNDAVRESVEILRFPEPGPDALPMTVDPDRLTVTYPNGAEDAEALVVAPNGDLFIITKVILGRGRLLRVPASAWGGDERQAEAIGSVDVGLLGIVTAADASPDGTVVAVRTYLDVYLFAGDSITKALTGRRCAAPAPAERQGEAITLTGTGYITIGEGVNPAIWAASS